MSPKLAPCHVDGYGCNIGGWLCWKGREYYKKEEHVFLSASSCFCHWEIDGLVLKGSSLKTKTTKLRKQTPLPPCRQPEQGVVWGNCCTWSSRHTETLVGCYAEYFAIKVKLEGSDVLPSLWAPVEVWLHKVQFSRFCLAFLIIFVQMGFISRFMVESISPKKYLMRKIWIIMWTCTV